MIARFYYSPRSCALASHIVLEHVGADFEVTVQKIAPLHNL